jgi:hypothetical protein
MLDARVRRCGLDPLKTVNRDLLTGLAGNTSCQVFQGAQDFNAPHRLVASLLEDGRYARHGEAGQTCLHAENRRPLLQDLFYGHAGPREVVSVLLRFSDAQQRPSWRDMKVDAKGQVIIEGIQGLDHRSQEMKQAVGVPKPDRLLDTVDLDQQRSDLKILCREAVCFPGQKFVTLCGLFDHKALLSETCRQPAQISRPAKALTMAMIEMMILELTPSLLNALNSFIRIPCRVLQGVPDVRGVLRAFLFPDLARLARPLIFPLSRFSSERGLPSEFVGG